MVEINATVNEVSIRNWNVNTGEYKARKCKVKTPEKFAKCDVIMVTFDSEEDGKFESVVKNGECDLPCFSVPGNVLVGVYAYTETDGKLGVRYSPTPVTMPIKVGSYINGQEPPTPTPGTYADLLEKIEDIENTGGGGSGDGCGITVVDEFDVEKVYGDKEVPSMNAFMGTLTILVDELVPKSDFENAEARVRDLSSELGEHKTTSNEKINDIETKAYLLESRLDIMSQKVELKQDKLTSGTNIKTINGESILGQGNISISGGGGSTEEEWVEVLKTQLTEDVAYVDMVAPDGKKFKKLHILISTGNAGLSAASKILVKGTKNFAFAGNNGENLTITSGTVNTHGFPTFILEKGALFPITFSTMGTNNGTSSTPVAIGGAGQLHSQAPETKHINNGAWQLIRIQPSTADVVFKANVKIYAWGVYEDA